MVETLTLLLVISSFRLELLFLLLLSWLRLAKPELLSTFGILKTLSLSEIRVRLAHCYILHILALVYHILLTRYLYKI